MIRWKQSIKVIYLIVEVHVSLKKHEFIQRGPHYIKLVSTINIPEIQNCYKLKIDTEVDQKNNKYYF